MKSKCMFTFVILLCFIAFRRDRVFGGDLGFGIGFTAGISRLEGDLKSPQLSPLISGHIRVLPLPYIAISGELGYSLLNTSNHPQYTDFKNTIIPFELSTIVNFLPFNKINPYVMAGGGGVYWSATGKNATGNRITLEDGIDSFLKTGGGLEFRLSRSFRLNLGATFRFSLTDAFDQMGQQGDENDQVLDVHAGLTYYFKKSRNDRDNDLIPDDLDLMPDIAEDPDGFLDHDGIPEKNPNFINSYDSTFDSDNSTSSPIVIHYIVHKAESGHSIPIKAYVYSDINLRVVATLYRPYGEPNWNVVRMEEQGDNLYHGVIPGYAVNTQGFEYCVVAVDETLSGIGYSGLPSKPVRVKVSPNGKVWRFLGGTVGAATIGTASYLVLRKQN
ncbi:MAG: hypothetical protein ACE5JB_00195 [bacterium]